jgi:hypothetical protein
VEVMRAFAREHPTAALLGPGMSGARGDLQSTARTWPPSFRWPPVEPLRGYRSRKESRRQASPGLQPGVVGEGALACGGGPLAHPRRKEYRRTHQPGILPLLRGRGLVLEGLDRGNGGLVRAGGAGDPRMPQQAAGPRESRSAPLSQHDQVLPGALPSARLRRKGTGPR